jgi:hypothetical protein
MGFVGDLLNSSKGSGFQASGLSPEDEAKVQASVDQQAKFLAAVGAQNPTLNQTSVFNQQQGLADTLNQQAQGAGPNPALAQLANTTGQNVNQQAALMAGQRGAGANAGLLARQAGQVGANAQQQAAGQAAVMRAQQQLAAQQALQQQQGMMAGLSTAQVGQYANAANAFNQGTQNLYNAKAGMQENINNNNASIAAKNQGAQMLGVAGGLMGGGVAGSLIGSVLGKSPVQGQIGKLGQADMSMGTIPQTAAQGGPILDYTHGGKLPGRAEVSGDSLKNDKVPIMGSPGEIMLPRSVTQHPNAPEMAAEFVRSILSKGGAHKTRMATGGKVTLPDNFNELVDQESKRLALNKGMPVSLNPMDQAPDVSQFNTVAANNIMGQGVQDAKQSQDNQDSAASKEAQEAAQKSKDLQINNELRAKYGLSQNPMTPDQPQPSQGNVPPSQQGTQGSNTDQSLAANQDYASQMMSGMSQQLAGVKAGYQAETQIGRDEQQTLLNAQAKNQELQDRYNTHYAALQQESDDLFKKAAEGKINPNQVWEDQSVPGKISTAISLILGGIGGALSGQENPALKFLNEQINRNVDAQKLNVNNKFNLLNENRRRFENEKEAVETTRLMNADSVVNGLKLAAAKSSDLMAKQRALSAAGLINEKFAPLRKEVALLRTIKGGGVDPSIQIRALVPENKQADAFKELDRVQNLAKQKKVILDAFDSMTKENTAMGRLSHGFSPPASVTVFENALMPMLKDFEGRVNETEINRTNGFKPQPGDLDKKKGEKREGLLNFMNEKSSSSLLKSFGINLDDALGNQDKIPEYSPFASYGKKHGI